MTDREKIRAYIEKLHKESSVRAQKAIEDADSDAYLQSAQKLATTSRLIRFIDSLPEEPVSESNKELAETYLAVFNKKFPILPSLSGKQLADYKNFLNKCQQIFGLKEWGIRSTQAKLFEKMSLLWAAWGVEHLQGVGRQDKKEQDIPVNEDLEEASKNYALNNTPWDDCKDEIQESFKAGAEWQKQQDSIPSKDLAELIDALSKRYPEVSFAKLSRIAVRVAKWQKEQDKKGE